MLHAGSVSAAVSKLFLLDALVLIEFGGEFYWMVGNPEINADSARQNEGKGIVFC